MKKAFCLVFLVVLLLCAQGPTPRNATITSGQSLSNSVYIGGALVAIEMPSVWTTASLTFQGSSDGVTFHNIYDDSGTEVTLSASASRTVTVGYYSGSIYMKVRSGTSGSPVSQGADRVLVLVINPAR